MTASTAVAAGPRHRRQPSGRRVVIEKLIILAVFLAALGVTVWLLASQWRLSASATSASATSAATANAAATGAASLHLQAPI